MSLTCGMLRNHDKSGCWEKVGGGGGGGKADASSSKNTRSWENLKPFAKQVQEASAEAVAKLKEITSLLSKLKTDAIRMHESAPEEQIAQVKTLVGDLDSALVATQRASSFTIRSSLKALAVSAAVDVATYDADSRPEP